MKSGVYICLFSDGTIKVGHGKDTSTRVTAHRSTGSCFGIEMVSSEEIWCFKPKLAEKQLINWCKANSSSVACREWFKGIDFTECVSVANKIAGSLIGPHQPAKVTSFVMDMIEQCRTVTPEKAAYSKGRSDFVRVSNPPEQVLAAMDMMHIRCEAVRRAAELGSIEPDWYLDLNVVEPWEVELFFCEGKPFSGLLKALANAVEAV